MGAKIFINYIIIIGSTKVLSIIYYFKCLFTFFFRAREVMKIS